MNMSFFEPLRKEINIQNRVLSLKETGIFILATIFLLGQWGCATQPPGLPAELRAQLGTIGVVSAQYTPAFEFELPAKGWLGGAARGAAGGTKAFILLVPSGAVLGGASAVAVLGNPVYAVLGALMSVGVVLKGAGYLIIGPFYGAAAAGRLRRWKKLRPSSRLRWFPCVFKKRCEIMWFRWLVRFGQM
jgi:hypothetical protein